MSSTRSRCSKIPCSLFALLVISLAPATLCEVRGQDTKKPVSLSELKAQVAKLRSRFHAERESAVQALGAAGKQAVPLLEKAAASDYPQERVCALRALCCVSPERAGKVVCEAVLSGNISLRLTALDIAKSLGIKGAQALLIKASDLPPEKRPVLRSIIARACLKHVNEMLGQIYNTVGRRGIFDGMYRELTKLGPVVEPALSRIVSDPSHGLAEAAASALAELEEKAAIRALKKAYLAGGRQLKENAAAALHVLGEDGPYNEVVSAYEKGCKEGGQYSYSQLSYFYSRAREYAKGEKVIKEQIERFGGSSIQHINLACFLSSQNKVDEAFEEFKKGIEKGFTNIEWVKIDGELAKLRASKKFQDYVREKFPENFKEPEKSEQDGEDD
jgi:tetratricopeptide (TPR) repeat protein